MTRNIPRLHTGPGILSSTSPPRCIGVVYQIYRRTTAEGEFTYLGGCGAKKFVDFLLSKEAQSIKTQLGHTYPVRGDVDPPQGLPPLSTIKLVKYDRKFAIENRARLTKEWEDEIGSKR